MLFVLQFVQSGSHQPDMSATQHKIYFINRKKRDEIRYHHGLGEGLFYDNLTISRSFLAYEKTLIKQLHFHSDSSSTLRFSSKIATEQIANQNIGILSSYSSSFFLCVQKFVEKRFGAGARGVPEPIQPLSLLNPGLWRLPCGIFPPRQVLGYPYCGIFAICASAFGGISTLCEGCRKGGVMLPITQEKIVLLNTA